MTVALNMRKQGLSFEYEPDRIPYTIAHEYIPDFKCGSIYIEAKGLFDADDRRKHLAIRAQHPALDIRLLFQDAHRPIRKGSKMSYAKWCDKHGIKWAHKTIPNDWITNGSSAQNVIS